MKMHIFTNVKLLKCLMASSLIFISAASFAETYTVKVNFTNNTNHKPFYLLQGFMAGSMKYLTESDDTLNDTAVVTLKVDSTAPGKGTILVQPNYNERTEQCSVSLLYDNKNNVLKGATRSTKYNCGISSPSLDPSAKQFTVTVTLK